MTQGDRLDRVVAALEAAEAAERQAARARVQNMAIAVLWGIVGVLATLAQYWRR